MCIRDRRQGVGLLGGGSGAHRPHLSSQSVERGERPLRVDLNELCRQRERQLVEWWVAPGGERAEGRKEHDDILPHVEGGPDARYSYWTGGGPESSRSASSAE